MRVARAAALAAAAWGLAAAPALANGDAACAWGRMPAKAREAAIAGYGAKGVGGVDLDRIPEKRFVEALGACGFSGDTAGVAVLGYALRLAAEREIQRQEGLTAAQLETAWRELRPAIRDLLRAAMLQMMEGELEPAGVIARRAVEETFAANAGLAAKRTAGLSMALDDYLVGRATQEHFERVS